jgi:hypothetical protein
MQEEYVAQFLMCIFVNCICLVCIFVILCVFVIRYVYCCSTLDAGLLARSQYPECPATSHLDTGFTWFPCVHKRMLRWFPVSKLLLHASHVALPT